MAPIRVGLIGLSGTPPDKYEGTSWTAIAHLPYLKASPHYEIVALLNTRNELPAETKTYYKPEDLAADKDVDLVVCSVRVDRHFSSVKASIIAGKAVFVEWPMDRNLEVAREMEALATKHKVKTILGLQASHSPVVRRLKEAIESGKIGKIHSSTQFTSLGFGAKTVSKNVRYFVDRDIGGNLLSIQVGHSLESIHFALGDFKTFQSLLVNTHPIKDIVDPSKGNEVVVKDTPNNVPNEILLQGILESSGAPFSLHYRGGKVFPGTPDIDWRIQGEDGELRLISPMGLNVGGPATKLELYDVAKDTVEVLEAEKDEWDSLPVPAQNIARVYEAYRKEEWYPDFTWGVKRHETLQKIWDQYDSYISEQN
ncbi:hypothetical protein HYALB_00000763 [Hymenoscyphus albidus]|uniref:Gfo/Idh/MocA-like oxidoreductase N-terminal domain-containing protein n=1 Tax=Hymenoscyphus albidus TaxID=595503 RepID=A0A9N9Q8P8_9HELO|nr:hypothetical protein HYALB_00000763 [Hymenoscyphus albidus]